MLFSQVIEGGMSEKLAALFTNATILRHDGGHFVPSTATVAAGYTLFLKQFIDATENQVKVSKPSRQPQKSNKRTTTRDTDQAECLDASVSEAAAKLVVLDVSGAGSSGNS